MRKIIYLILLSLCLTGCYDYQELNDRAIIVGLSVDYQNDEYLVNFEVLNSQKSNSDQNGSGKSQSYLIEGQASSFPIAYQNALQSLDKDAYLAHLKTVIFSEEIAKNHLENIVDYLIRDPNTRNVFYPVISKDVDAKEILSKANEESPVVSTAIEGLIEYNNYKESISTNINFEKFLGYLFNNHKDAYLNAVTLSSENKVKIVGLAIFQKYQMVKILDQQESATLNLLNNESNNYYLSIPCYNNQDKNLTVSLYDNDATKIEVTKDNITINAKYKANIMDDECGYNFKDPNIYNDIENHFATILNEKITTTVNYFKNLKSDVLAIQKKYYIKTKQPLPKWYNLEVKSNTTILLDKNGVIFEVMTND